VEAPDPAGRQRAATLRVAVVAGPDPGHAFPAAALALRLAAAGHTARLFTGGRFGAPMRAAGIDPHPLPLLAPQPGDDDGDFGGRVHARAGRMAVPLAGLLADFGAHLVVGDVATTAGGMAAQMLGLPWVELVPHLLHLPSAALPPAGSGLAPGRGPAGRTRDRVLRRLHGRALATGQRQRAAVRAGLGLPERDPGPTRRMVATLPGLEYPRPDWPAGTAVVGPLLWDPAGQDLAPPPGAAPLVFVAGSTSANGWAGLLPAALAGLAGAGVRLAATVLADTVPAGTALADTAPADTGPAEMALADAGLSAGTRRPGPAGPAWAAVGPGRQDPLLAAAAVAVTGGGHGIVVKALRHGVPVVVAPGGGDQRDVAQRVRWTGAGLVLRERSARAVAAAVHAVLADPGYRAAALRLAAGHAGTDPVAVCTAAVTGSAVSAPPTQPAQ
jgi:UDP:flavonoid glycosyltransferase YjiC (YdhE family)